MTGTLGVKWMLWMTRLLEPHNLPDPIPHRGACAIQHLRQEENLFYWLPSRRVSLQD